MRELSEGEYEVLLVKASFNDEDLKVTFEKRQEKSRNNAMSDKSLEGEYP